MKKLFSTVFITIMAFGFAKAQTVVYSEDFASGIPAGWGNKGTSNGSANANVKFVYTLNQAAGSGGGYGQSYGTISSPSKANGYISFDSDSLDERNTQNQAGGVAPAPQFVELTTTAINITGYPKLRLQFYQDLANFQSVTSVGISKDSINWTYDTVNVDQAVNSSTLVADQKVSIDISSLITGSNKVYIRFVMDANYYFWAIDDISLMELPGNDLAVKSYVGFSTTTDALGVFFSSFPTSQIDSVATEVTYGNVGRYAQPHTKAQIAITKNGTQLGGTYVTTPSVASLPSNKDTFDDAMLPTAGVGAYKASVFVSSDSTDYDLSNNSDTLAFAVNDSIFSINQGAISNSVYFLLRNNFGLAFQVGTLFEVLHDDTVTSVTTAVIGGSSGNVGFTRAGSVIQASVYPITVGSSSLSYSAPAVSTYPDTLKANQISSTSTFRPVTMKINNSSGNPILSPGLYWVAIKGVSTPDSNIAIVATEYQTNGLPLIDDGQGLGLLSSTDAAYCNLNFGHAADLLYVDFTRTPGTTPVKVGTPMTFTAISNASNTATYSWTFTSSPNVGYTYASLSGKIVKDTFWGPDPDTINVCVTATDGASHATTCKTVRTRAWGVGVEEVSPLAQVALVPNPTTGKVTISADNITGTMEISITNLLGEEVKHYNETSNGSFVRNYNLSDLSGGIYIVKLQNGSNAITKRLSISK